MMAKDQGESTGNIYVNRLRPRDGVKIADLFVRNTDEGIRKLHRYAARLGIKRRKFKDVRNFPHYNLTESEHADAISQGADLVSQEKFRDSIRKNFLTQLQRDKEISDGLG